MMNSNKSNSGLISLSFDKLKKYWKADMMSGLLIFLIALPLSLGIAMASNVPPMAGIISACVGGLVVAIFSGSHLTICGPAAGLIVLIINGVETLGNGDAFVGYRYTLAAIVIAGIFQIIFGAFKSGKLSTFFPAAAVHGMMAAIGMIIMSKQIHTLFGMKPTAKSIFGIIGEIPNSVANMNPEIAVIGISSLLMLILIPKIPLNWVKKIPVPMVVVLAGIFFDRVFDLEHEHIFHMWNHDYTVGPKMLIQLPKNLSDGIVFPDWGLLATGKFWFVTVSIALVASLETLLSASAIQGIDPEKRKADFDKDLVALGVGTTVSGLLGGLPMIAEIVRSSANVNNGAKTPWSNWFHGFFLLASVCTLPWLLQKIPLASLAAILVFVGWRLAGPKEFVKIYKEGSEAFLVFCVTIFFTLAEDLLVGVFVGIVVRIILHTIRGLKPNEIFFTNVFVDDPEAEKVNVKITTAATFWSIFKVKETLYNLPNAKSITVDVSVCKVVDDSMTHFLDHYKKECDDHGIKFNLVGSSGKPEDVEIAPQD